MSEKGLYSLKDLQQTAFHITSNARDGKSYVEKIFHSQPLKMTRAFKMAEGGIKVYIMSASPGLLEGDVYDFKINVKTGSKLWLTSQSFEKLYPSEDIGSFRNSDIVVESGAYLKYVPLPTTPYRDSIFTSNTKVQLTDKSSKFVMSEVLTAGRTHKDEANEVFKYTRYSSLINVHMGDELIYRDNAIFEPKKIDMTGFGMYEGYTHLANIQIINFELDETADAELRAILATDDRLEGGISRMYTGDIIIRMFGMNGQELIDMGEKLIEYAEKTSNIVL